MSDFQEYPKWVPVEGDGHPAYPGHELAQDADEEKALTAPAKGKKA